MGYGVCWSSVVGSRGTGASPALNNQLAPCPDCGMTIDIPDGATTSRACGRQATASSYI
jgi:hypothetical protein